MGRLACIDGITSAPEEAKVSVYDRGFLYGDSIFETIRTYAGEPYALDEHMARLERSAALVAIEMPIDKATLALEVRRVIRAARNDESSARVMLTRGAGPMGLDPSLALKPTRVILVEPLTPPGLAVYRDGVSVITTRAQRASDAAHGAKVGNYLASLLALKTAHAAGAHEAVFVTPSVDHDGDVVEGATSNVFIVKDGALITPPPEAGILVGITRAHVLDVARELGLEAREARVIESEMRAADEVFITSSIREIVSVIAIDGARVGNGTPGPITRRIHTAFRAKVGLGALPLPWSEK
jgi:branched-chain amino acid aminotransferase